MKGFCVVTTKYLPLPQCPPPVQVSSAFSIGYIDYVRLEFSYNALCALNFIISESHLHFLPRLFCYKSTDYKLIVFGLPRNRLLFLSN